MLARLRSRLTFANVTSSLALFVALGGTAYAAAALPKNSVGPKQLKKGAVTSVKLRDRSVRVADINPKALRALDGAQGPQGPKGDRGPKGDQGIPGPVDVRVFKGALTLTQDSATGTPLVTVPGVGVVKGRSVPVAAGCEVTFTNESGATMAAGGITQTKGALSGADPLIANNNPVVMTFVDFADDTGSGAWQFMTPGGQLTVSFLVHTTPSSCEFRAQAYLTG